MKTSRVKAYYQDYIRAVNKYGYRHVFDCYKNPSLVKVTVEEAIVNDIHSKDSYGHSVISYNRYILTYGYLFNRDGELWFAVYTPNYYGEMKVEED